MKKVGLYIVIVIILSVAVFHGYSFYVKSEFEGYLSKNYPNRVFQVDYPKYNLVDRGILRIGDYFYTSAYCDTDETKFFMSRRKGKISDNYFKRKNKKILVDTVSSYITKSDFGKYMNSVVVGEKTKIDFDVEKLEDIKNSVEVVIIYYNDNIKDNKDFAEVSYGIINTLRSNKLNFDGIYFTSDRKDGVYEINLKGEEIAKTPTELLEIIRKVK